MDEQKPETRTPVDSPRLSSGVTFGARGCLTTLAGFILGAVIGVGLTVFLSIGPGYSYSISIWSQDGIALMLAFMGGFLGFK